MRTHATIACEEIDLISKDPVEIRGEAETCEEVADFIATEWGLLYIYIPVIENKGTVEYWELVKDWAKKEMWIAEEDRADHVNGHFRFFDYVVVRSFVPTLMTMADAFIADIKKN